MTERWLSTFPGYTATLNTVKKFFANIIQTGPVPQHIGFVMDGNRRFAKRENIELKEGHNAGFESMAKVLEICYECGVKSATVFAFSIENFKRNKMEVMWLMELAKTRFTQIVQNGELCEKYGIQVRIIGDKSMLPKDVLEVLNEAEKITRDNTRAILNVAFPYTSRHEMTHALKTIVNKNIETLNLESITESYIEEHLYTGDQPPLDLLIRTSGVSRLSDFMLWQISKKGEVEMELSEKLWPDLTPWDICWILIKYSFNKSYNNNTTAALTKSE